MLKRYFSYKKRFIIPAIILVLAIIARMILPEYLLRKTNTFLAEFSPTYSLHIEDFDLDLWRGAYRFEGITGKLKENNSQFIKVKSVDVSIAWRELLNRRILTDITIDKLDLLVIKDMGKLSPPKKEGKDIKETLFPVQVERVSVLNSNLTFMEIPSLDESKRLRLTNLEGAIHNLTPTKHFSNSDFNLKANILNSANLFVEGAISLLRQPLAWDADFEIKNFDLTKLNPYLKKNVPLTFNNGELDLYAEAMSKDGKTQGYIKPFFKKLEVIGKQEEFSGLKHFGAEVLTSLSNAILRDPKTKTVATIVAFNYDGELHLQKGQTLSKALEHGFSRRINPGIDQKYRLD
jgi:hypothetical protein